MVLPAPTPLHENGENSGFKGVNVMVQLDLENGMPRKERDKGNMSRRIFLLSPVS